MSIDLPLQSFMEACQDPITLLSRHTTLPVRCGPEALTTSIPTVTQPPGLWLIPVSSQPYMRTSLSASPKVVLSEPTDSQSSLSRSGIQSKTDLSASLLEGVVDRRTLRIGGMGLHKGYRHNQ